MSPDLFRRPLDSKNFILCFDIVGQLWFKNVKCSKKKKRSKMCLELQVKWISKLRTYISVHYSNILKKLEHVKMKNLATFVLPCKTFTKFTRKQNKIYLKSLVRKTTLKYSINLNYLKCHCLIKISKKKENIIKIVLSANMFIVQCAPLYSMDGGRGTWFSISHVLL